LSPHLTGWLDYRRTLHNQWGLSLYLQSQRGNEQRTIMLDFGYTPEALLNNIELTGADPAKINAMVVSHGHFDHYAAWSASEEISQRAAGRRQTLRRR